MPEKWRRRRGRRSRQSQTGYDNVTSEPEPVVTLKPRERAPTPKKRPGIKERTHQFSLYIEPEVYDVLRGIAFEERIKLHALVTEGLDLVLRKRGSPSIRELIKKAG